MNRAELMNDYYIPINILKKYHVWNQKDINNYQYTLEDVKLLTSFIRLDKIGFSFNKICDYLNLLADKEDTKKERIKMMKCHRELVLEQIHNYEKQIEIIDYLYYQLQQ